MCMFMRYPQGRERPHHAAGGMPLARRHDASARTRVCPLFPSGM